MITNVAAALMLDPSIKEKIVVVWLGTNCFSNGSLSEVNLRGDYRAGQLVMNSGVPLVVLPASGETGEGTQMLSVDQEDVKAIRGNGRSAVFSPHPGQLVAYPVGHRGAGPHCPSRVFQPAGDSRSRSDGRLAVRLRQFPPPDRLDGFPRSRRRPCRPLPMHLAAALTRLSAP